MIKWIKKKIEDRRAKKLQEERRARKEWSSPSFTAPYIEESKVASAPVQSSPLVDFLVWDAVINSSRSHKAEQNHYNDTEPYVDNISKPVAEVSTPAYNDSYSYDSTPSPKESSYDSGSSYSSPSYDSGSSYDSGGSYDSGSSFSSD